jgi:hypothetical protein
VTVYAGRLVAHDFWDVVIPNCWVNSMTVSETYRHHLLEFLPNVSLNASVLAIHVRGGDIFTDFFAPWAYGQPPCQFYFDAIRMDDHTSIHLFSQDKLNPCVDGILQEANVVWTPQSLDIEIALMLSAKRFVLSRSSFARALVYLSPVTKVFYTCGYPWQDMGPHFECSPTLPYQRLVLDRWWNTRKQIDSIRTASCGLWAVFEYRL